MRDPFESAKYFCCSYEAMATISADTDRRAGPSATADSCQCLLCIQANGAAMRLV